MPALNATQLGDIESGFDSVSAIALRYFLKYQNLAVGHASKEKLVERIREYMDDGTLPPIEVLTMLRELQENRNKRVYFYRVPRAAVAHAFEIERAVADLGLARIRRGTTAGEISYSYDSTTAIRVCFAELQHDIVVDVAQGTVTKVATTNVIVLHVDKTNGFVTLSYDPPSRITSHPSNDAYYRSYRRRGEELLGIPLRSVDLGNALDGLQTSPLARPRNLLVDTVDGSVQLNGDHGDCRQMTVAPGVELHVTGRDRGHYEWLTAPDVAAQQPMYGVYLGVVPLLRTVPTDIYADPGIVRFSRDCLPNEVNFIVQEIRALV